MKRIGVRSIGIAVALLLVGSLLSIPVINPSRSGSLTMAVPQMAVVEDPFDRALNEVLAGRAAAITAQLAAGKTLAEEAPLEFYREAALRAAELGLTSVQIAASDDPYIVGKDCAELMADRDYADGYAVRLAERLNSKHVRVRSNYNGLMLTWDQHLVKR